MIKSKWHLPLKDLSEEDRIFIQERNKQRWLDRKTKLGQEAINLMVEKDRLRKYGLSKQDIETMRVRQFNRCPITQEEFTKTPCVDHDHETGEVRGLLSRNANTALGLLKENPESFYRAVAYLKLDRSKEMIYTIGSLRNPKILEVAASLRELGYDAFDNWMSAGERADDSWQEYAKHRGMTYKEALQSREANHVFHFDKAYLDLCDKAILVMPAGKSGHLELGYVAGRGKPTFILTDGEPDRYDVMPQFADKIFTSKEEMLEYFEAQQS
jgi:recombination endonuclease VII